MSSHHQALDWINRTADAHLQEYFQRMNRVGFIFNSLTVYMPVLVVMFVLYLVFGEPSHTVTYPMACGLAAAVLVLAYRLVTTIFDLVNFERRHAVPCVVVTRKMAYTYMQKRRDSDQSIS